MNSRGRESLTDVIVVAVGMLVFALFAHRDLPLILIPVVVLGIIAVHVSRSLPVGAQTAQPVSRGAIYGRLLLFSAVGITLGIVAASAYRRDAGLSPLPQAVQPFVLVSCAVGVCEELLYRGWMLTRIGTHRWPTAIAATALAHALYKTALFAWPATGVTSANLAWILIWTTAGGLVLGALRVASRSVVPPALAHAAFDFVLYGAFVQAPWWVWQ
jgi:membrane protease YdiL (CAAX protease family)